MVPRVKHCCGFSCAGKKKRRAVNPHSSAFTTVFSIKLLPSHGSYLGSGLVTAPRNRGGNSWDKKGGSRGSHRCCRSWKWDRMGKSILEHIGLSVKYARPAVPAVCYSRCLLVVPLCAQGDMRPSGEARPVGRGSSRCHRVLVIAGKLAS